MRDFSKASERVQQALAMATKAHFGQKDKAGKDYILHPMTVAGTVYDMGDDYIIVALLHDVVEDTDVTIDEIEAAFGKNIADTVSIVTHDESDSYMDYVRRIKESGNDIAFQVKLADMKNNMDLGRQTVITEKDIDRLEKKYIPALRYLLFG